MMAVIVDLLFNVSDIPCNMECVMAIFELLALIDFSVDSSMHDGVQYDPIQGQGQGHEPFEVVNPAIFKSYLLRHLQWELATDHRFLNCGTISIFLRPDF